MICKRCGLGEEAGAFKKDSSKESGFREIHYGCSDARRKAVGEGGLLEVEDVQVRSLQDLTEQASIDLSVWDAQKVVVKTRETAKGTSFAVDAAFKRKGSIGEVEIPLIAPVSVKVSGRPSVFVKPKSEPGQIKRALIIPDSQNGYVRRPNGKLIPLHDRRAWDLCTQIAQLWQPDQVVYLGDMLDLPDWSLKFLRSPDMYFTTQPALVELAWTLGRMREATGWDSQHTFLEGNHEFRLTTALCTNLIQAYGLYRANDPSQQPVLSIPYLLDLASLRIDYRGSYPNGEHWINDNLRAIHGNTVRSESGDSVKTVLKDLRHSEICGHIHRVEYACKTLYHRGGPKVYMACSPGTICNITGPVPRTTNRVNWQQGCALVEYNDEGNFQVQLIQIYEGECIFRGVKLYGVDYAEEIRNQFPEFQY